MPNMTRRQNRQEDIQVMTSRKKEERAKREAYKKERKIESYLADDENFPSFSIQLEKLGLQLRDIPGDGNCLFRALGDQLEGHCRNHFRHRQDVVRYMLEHRSDFEPFIEDDIPFETHINNLRKLGVYAGNDAIVAFARLYQVNVIIHQLNAKHLMISGSPGTSTRQLHISYHNGDHYSSVRKLHDNTESPANIRIQDESDKRCDPVTGGKTKDVGPGYVRAVRGCQVIEEEVIAATRCTDLKLLRDTLGDCDYDADAAIAHLLQMMELTDTAEDNNSVSSQLSTTTDSGMWSDTNTGLNRVYGNSNKNKSQRVHFREDSLGGSSGYGSMNSNHGGARPKLIMTTASQFMSQAQPLHGSTGRIMSSRKQKELKRREKKQRAEERHRQLVLGNLQTQSASRSTTPTQPALFRPHPSQSSHFTVI